MALTLFRIVREFIFKAFQKKPFITVQTRDGELFNVDQDIIQCSRTITTLLEKKLQQIENEVILLDIANGSLFRKVLEWAEHYKNKPEFMYNNQSILQDIEFIISPWDIEFFSINQQTLFGIAMVAKYLKIEGLYKMTCHYIKEKIQDKQNQTNDLELRKFLGFRQ